MTYQKTSSPLASPIEIQHALDDLKLPKERIATLQELAVKIRRQKNKNRFCFPKRGTLALFSGPSGTGKTLAASWLANRLNLPLYRVDLASVVNKYIGETEKNLSSLLAQAESGDVILLFDEADALFGKRTEVQGRRDRNTDRAVNDILEKLSKYRGIAILAAKIRKTEESALKERLSTIVDILEE